MTLSVILASMLMILSTIYSNYDQASDLWQQLELVSELLPTRHCRLELEVACRFQCWKNSFERSTISGTHDVKRDGSVFEEKSFFKVLGLSLLDWIGTLTLPPLLKLPL